MYSSIFKNIIYPLSQTIRGRNYLPVLRTLRDSQWWTPEQLREVQWLRLKKLLDYVYENVNFYKNRFNDAGIQPGNIKNFDDLAKIPILTKKDIKENLQHLIAKDYPTKKLIPGRTGGSTGEPMYFYYDIGSLNYNRPAIFRNLEWAGLEQGDKHVIMSGSHYDYTEAQKSIYKLRDKLLRCRKMTSTNLDNEKLYRYADELRNWKPKVLWGYASAIYLLAEFLRKEKITDIKLNSVITSSETLHPTWRNLIEEAFHTKVFDLYGGRELFIAGECKKHQGYHICDECIYVEVVRGGVKASEGEMGKLLITDLNNYGFPMLRYEIGDIGAKSSHQCSCGRGLSMLSKIEGRISDIILTVDGRFITPPSITVPLSDIEGVKQYQLVQKKKEEVELNLVINDKYTSEDTAYIANALQDILGTKTSLKINFIDRINVSESGKRRVIISDIANLEL